MFRRPDFGTSVNLPTGPAWLMVLGYALALLVLQSLFSRLFSSFNIPPPDLFLLTGIALARRVPPISALIGAYFLGLIQDVLGAGAIGLHAAALTGGVLLVLLTRRFAPAGTLGQTVVAVLAALLGQWLTFMILTYWLKTGLVTIDSLVRILPLSFIATVLVAPLWEWLSDYALGRAGGSLE